MPVDQLNEALVSTIINFHPFVGCTDLEHTQRLERCIELDYLFCMGKGVLTMAFPNNPINIKPKIDLNYGDYNKK